MERRQWRWKYLEVMQHWPPGSILILQPGEEKAQSEEMEIPLQWSFRRPNAAHEEELDLVASGETALSMRKVGEEWKVSHVERLIAALHTEVVKEQK
jgi:hypothetical protein